MTAQSNMAPVSVAPFHISRTFNAPRDLVYKTWTVQEHMEKWFGPKGSSMRNIEFDFRVGGKSFYSMTMPDGTTTLYGQFVYEEITPPSRLVYVQNFADKDGNLGIHPFAPSWPKYMRTTVDFTEENGKTTVSVMWEPIDPTAEEARTFEDGRSGMNQGWGGSFDQLDTYLATLV